MMLGKQFNMILNKIKKGRREPTIEEWVWEIWLSTFLQGYIYARHMERIGKAKTADDVIDLLFDFKKITNKR